MQPMISVSTPSDGEALLRLMLGQPWFRFYGLGFLVQGLGGLEFRVSAGGFEPVRHIHAAALSLGRPWVLQQMPWNPFRNH